MIDPQYKKVILIDIEETCKKKFKFFCDFKNKKNSDKVRLYLNKTKTPEIIILNSYFHSKLFF